MLVFKHLRATAVSFCYISILSISSLSDICQNKLRARKNIIRRNGVGSFQWWTIDCTTFPFCKQEAVRPVSLQKLMDACTLMSSYMFPIICCDAADTNTCSNMAPREQSMNSHAHQQLTPDCHNFQSDGRVCLTAGFIQDDFHRNLCRAAYSFPNEIWRTRWVSRLSETAMARCKCHRVTTWVFSWERLWSWDLNPI